MEETIRSLESKLNSTIDSELEKDIEKIDCKIILECCDGLLRLGSTEKFMLTAQQLAANKSAILGRGTTDIKSKKSRKTLRVILIAAAIAVLLAVAAFGYAQVKYNIIHFSDHSTVVFGYKNNKKVYDLTVGYIPEGFELVEEDHKDTIWIETYKKGEMFISIGKSNVFSDVDIDTEFNDSKTVNHNGIDYIISGEELGGHGVVWIANDYMFNIVTNISEEEMLKIAFSTN